MAKNTESQAQEATVEELKAELAKALEEAKAEQNAAKAELAKAQAELTQAAEELKQIREERDRLAEAAKDAEEKLAVEETKPGAPAEELVTVKLFKDNERYKDDVFVAVNGQRFQIQRGVPVQVPKYVADVLEQSMEQDTATSQMMERESAEFQRAAQALGI